MKHRLYKTGDHSVPEGITDRNGEVVLAECKVCRKAEAQLTGDKECRPTPRQALIAINDIIYAAGLALGSKEYFQVRGLCASAGNIEDGRFEGRYWAMIAFLTEMRKELAGTRKAQAIDNLLREVAIK